MSVRLLMVDDSMLVRSMLRSLIESWPDYQIIGEAGNGLKALEAARQLHPDLILMDVNMPEMNGIDATGRIMKECPAPIVIFTSEDVSEVGYRAINNGAMEVVPKPDIGKMNNPEFVSGFKTMLDHAAKYGALRMQGGKKSAGPAPSHLRRSGREFRLLVIGASTGGPSSVRTVLAGLPAHFPLPILISQHIEEGFDEGYASWLNQDTELTVRVAGEREELKPGLVLVAPATHHLVCTENGVRRDDGPRVGNQKPSVDKMFQSAAKLYGKQLLGVLLTGMGRDGAEGCRSIVDRGGITLVQNQDTSMIFGMPKAAIELGAASEILPLEQIPVSLKEWVMP